MCGRVGFVEPLDAAPGKGADFYGFAGHVVLVPFNAVSIDLPILAPVATNFHTCGLLDVCRSRITDKMESFLILLLLAYMFVLVQNDEGMVVQLPSLVGIKRRLTRSESTFVLILGGLVVLALFVALAPETRIFLMFLDSVGVDLFVTMCVLYLRHNLVLVAAILLIPILKWAYRWGPVPGFWPSRLVIRSSATWAGYAVVVPVMTLCGAALAAICIAAVLSGVVRLLGLI